MDTPPPAPARLGDLADRIARDLGELPEGLPLSPAAAGRLDAAARAAADLACAAGAGSLADLAGAIARVADGVRAGVVAFEALPYLGSAADVLRRAAATLAAPDPAARRLDATPLVAARFELETLLPATGARPTALPGAPDVPVAALRRRDARPG